MIFDWGSLDEQDNPDEKLMVFLVYHLGLFARKEDQYHNHRLLYVTVPGQMSLQDIWLLELNKVGSNAFGVHREAIEFGNKTFTLTVELLIDIVFLNYLTSSMEFNRSVIYRTSDITNSPNPRLSTVETHPRHLAAYDGIVRARVQSMELKRQTLQDRQRIFAIGSEPNADANQTEGEDELHVEKDLGHNLHNGEEGQINDEDASLYELVNEVLDYDLNGITSEENNKKRPLPSLLDDEDNDD